MSLDDWILALHVLAAFSVMAGITLFWVLVVAVRRADTADATLRMAPAAKVGNAVTGIGMGGTIVLGVWLALSYGDYDIWDGWIIAAIVLWAVAAELGRRTGLAYAEGAKKAAELQQRGEHDPNAELHAVNRTSVGLALQTASTAVLLLILIDMIWKPGA